MTRVYLIGFEPEGLTQSRVERTRLMQSCDFCIWSEAPLEPGSELEVARELLPGSMPSPGLGSRFRVVRTEELGKVAVLELLSSSAS